MSELTDRLRAWARRYEPRSIERRLMLEAAERIEILEVAATPQVIVKEVIKEVVVGPVAEDAPPPVGLIEKWLGGALLPWQRRRLESQQAPTE